MRLSSSLYLTLETAIFNKNISQGIVVTHSRCGVVLFIIT